VSPRSSHPSHDTPPMTMDARRSARRRAVICAAAALAAWPAAADAQSSWRDQIARQMSSSSLVSNYRDRGYTVAHDTRYDLVADGEKRTVSYALEGGRTYQFIAKCDLDCSDLDLRVIDASGTVVDTDIDMDDHPIVSASPTRDATYRVEITMADCSVSRCGWGIVVMASPGRATQSIRASSSASEPAWREQIRRQLASSGLVSSYRNDGFAESHDTFYDLVATGASESVTVDLRAGRDYRFVGKCDADCSDLDFQLYDPSGTLIDSDLLTDDVPVISVSPSRTGTYRLRVTMASCSVALCGWGVIVLAR